MSGVWQHSDKPIQATDRESASNFFPRHFATPANDISPLATSSAGVVIPETEAHPCDSVYHDHEESPRGYCK